MINALLAAAALSVSAADTPEDQPCSEEQAVHVQANHNTCLWIAPPPVTVQRGGSDYSGLSGAYVPLSTTRRTSPSWRLSSGDTLPLDAIPASVFEAEKAAIFEHYTACRTPEAVARLGAEIAQQRAHQAFDCWRFLQDDRVRREGEPVIEDRYDDEPGGDTSGDPGADTVSQGESDPAARS